MKIGFYDSGLGGIKTLKDIIEMGLKGEIYYLADEKNKPYGTKKEEEIRKIAIENVGKLVDLGCKIVVVACNTATSVAISELREKFCDIEIIGTEPAVKLAVDEHKNKDILLLATTITVKGKKLKNLISELNYEGKIELLAADRLVTLVEDENFLNNQEEINNYLREILFQYNLENFSHIVLGCTHFPIVKENIQKIVKEKNSNLKVIDGNEGIGKNLFSKIVDKEDNELTIKIINTSESNAFCKRAKEILENTNQDKIENFTKNC